MANPHESLSQNGDMEFISESILPLGPTFNISGHSTALLPLRKQSGGTQRFTTTCNASTKGSAHVRKPGEAHTKTCDNAHPEGGSLSGMGVGDGTSQQIKTSTTDSPAGNDGPEPVRDGRKDNPLLGVVVPNIGA